MKAIQKPKYKIISREESNRRCNRCGIIWTHLKLHWASYSLILVSTLTILSERPWSMKCSRKKFQRFYDILRICPGTSATYCAVYEMIFLISLSLMIRDINSWFSLIWWAYKQEKPLQSPGVGWLKPFFASRLQIMKKLDAAALCCCQCSLCVAVKVLLLPLNIYCEWRRNRAAVLLQLSMTALSDSTFTASGVAALLTVQVVYKYGLTYILKTFSSLKYCCVFLVL